MNAETIAERMQALIDAAPRGEQRWLRRLFLDPACYKTYTSLDSALFLNELGAGEPVLISSATRGEGRTTIALLLAALTCAADRSRRVLLVDADVNGGRLATAIGAVAGKPGLAELFDGAATSEQCIQPTALPNLFVTPRAASAAGVTSFSPGLFKQFVDKAAPGFDRIVVDSPARGASSAVLPMAKIVRTTLVVIRYGGPTREQVASLLRELEHAGARVLGCVLNKRKFVVPGFLYGAR